MTLLETIPPTAAPFGSVAFGDIALGDGTGLGADNAFGEDGGLSTDTGCDTRWSFGFGTDFGFPVDEADGSWLLRSVIAPCSAIAADPFLTTLLLIPEVS